MKLVLLRKLRKSLSALPILPVNVLKHSKTQGSSLNFGQKYSLQGIDTCIIILGDSLP